jgi:hypothetical protein
VIFGRRRSCGVAAAEPCVLEDVELAAELPDPRILDDYEEVIPGARGRLLRLRRLAGSWDEVGVVMWSMMRQLDRELRHEVPGWPGKPA